MTTEQPRDDRGRFTQRGARRLAERLAAEWQAAADEAGVSTSPPEPEVDFDKVLREQLRVKRQLRHRPGH